MDLQQSILDAIKQLSVLQREKLLEFIQSMLVKENSTAESSIARFSGIFDEMDKKEFELAIQDCNHIDTHEW